MEVMVQWQRGKSEIVHRRKSAPSATNAVRYQPFGLCSFPWSSFTNRIELTCLILGSCLTRQTCPGNEGGYA